MAPATWLDEVLWRDGVTDGWRAASGGGRVERFVAVPSAEEPQQLLPWRWTSVAAAAARRSDDRRPSWRWRDAAGATALLATAAVSKGRRFGVAAGDSLVERVGAELGVAGARGTVLCGPPRANRKAVVQLHDRRGRTCAWVKVAHNELTRALLDAEVASLTALADGAPDAFRVPAVLARGDFDGVAWAALEPLGVERRHRPALDAVDAVARAIEATAPPSSGPAAASVFAARLRRLSAGLPAAEPAVARLAERAGQADLPLAASHGDFVPWNMLSGEPRPAVWDWERYDRATPVGFDRIHYRVQLGIQRRGRSLADAVAAAEADLGRGGELTAAQWHDHIGWYLADLLCRYEGDAREHATPRLLGRIAALSAVLTERGAVS